MSIRKIPIYNGKITLHDKANRTARLMVAHDHNLPVFATLSEVDPSKEYQCRTINGEVIFTVPRRSIKGRLGATEYQVEFYQFSQHELAKPATIPVEKFELSNINPEKKEGEKEVVKKEKTMLSAVKNNRLSRRAIEKSTNRKNNLIEQRKEFIEAKALKPVGLQGRRVLTCDDVGYTKAAGIIKYLMILENQFNEGVLSEADRKLINEFFDCFSFSGTSSIIALYLALGKKSVGYGSIEYLLKWWTHHFRFAFSLTPAQNAKIKLAKIFKGKEPEGLSEKNARRYLQELFINPNSGEQYTLKDINIEVYQPLMFDDLRARAYTKGETPDTKLVDIAVNCALDPRRFSVKQTEDVGTSLGAFRRSYDLPLAQNNPGIKITSLGVPLRYQPPKKSSETANIAQQGMISKEANYVTDYHDTIQFMDLNPDRVHYYRVEIGAMDAISDYSVNRDNLRYAIASADKATKRSNNQKLLS